MRSCLLALLLATCLGALPARAGGMAVVINSADASISLIDMDSHAEVRRVPVLREPHHMALTPDGQTLLVGDTTGNTLFELNPMTGAVKGRIAVSDPYQLEFSPDGKWLTIAGLARNQIDIYDAASMTLAHRIPASSMPSHMNYAPDSSVVYVSLQGSNALMAIETASGKVLWKKKVGETPAGVMWLNGQLLVGDMGTDTVSVVDPVSGEVVRKLVTGRGAHNLFLSPDRSALYVCNRVAGTISVLDPKTLMVQRTIKMAGGPDDMDFAPDGKIWITRRFAHSVAVLNPATGDYSLIQVGRSPHGIWLNPKAHISSQMSMK